MDLAIAFVIGGLCGWLLARVTGQRSEPGERRTFRPNKRQRKILATLPPDPVRPSFEDLVREEAIEQGVDQIPGAGNVSLAIRLKVWVRDHADLEPCAATQLVFVLAHGVDPAAATETDLRLECRRDDEVPHGDGNTG